MRGVEAAEGRVARLGERFGGAEASVYLVVELSRYGFRRYGSGWVRERTWVHAGPDMRITAMAALPGAVERA